MYNASLQWLRKYACSRSLTPIPVRASQGPLREALEVTSRTLGGRNRNQYSPVLTCVTKYIQKSGPSQTQPCVTSLIPRTNFITETLESIEWLPILAVSTFSNSFRRTGTLLLDTDLRLGSQKRVVHSSISPECATSQRESSG
ncbi:hypothetical protein PM082_022929 [Marasmius tenuissimus]|nr:hypothetical protein PM082_022929 [Marasmius tenuissimus]